MPPRLPTLSALRGSMQLPQGLARAFSSTPAAHVDSSSSDRPSSTHSLLSLNRPSRRVPPPRSKDDTSSPSGSRSTEAAKRILSRYRQMGRADSASRHSTQDQLREQKVANDYLREMPRRWKIGDVYAPHDLSFAEMQKTRRRRMRQADVIDVLGIRPQDMYKNFSIIKEFTHPTGQILSSRFTGLRPVNQRKVAKMIRRAVGMGIYPSVHDHPEMLRERFFPYSGGRI